MKKKTKKPTKISRKVTARAKCASFDIEVSATFFPHGLASSEVEDVKRKLRQNIANAVATLPFAHVYPCEVRTR